MIPFFSSLAIRATLVIFAVGLLVSPLAQSAPMLAGVAKREITPPIGVPLSGYGGIKRRILPFDFFGHYPYATFMRPSEGIRDPLYAKAFYIENSEALRILFLSLDIIGLPEEMRADIESNLHSAGLNDVNLIASATHTHNGPGTLSRNLVWELLTTDRFRPEVYWELLGRVTEAAQEAIATAAPAELWSVKFDTDSIQKNRRKEGDPIDQRARLLLAKRTGAADAVDSTSNSSTTPGEWMGGIVNYAVHPTSLSQGNLLFSSDLSGAIENTLSNRLTGGKGIFLFVNGAEGDVGPFKKGEEHLPILAERFGEQAVEGMGSARLIDGIWRISTQTVEIGKAGLNLKGCISSPFLRSLIHHKLRFPLAHWMTQEARIWAIQLGDQWITTWPGEPTASNGERLRQLARAHGAEDAWVFGLTNDYLGYFTDKAEYKAGGYESCSTLYTYKGAKLILKGFETLFSAQ